jgi:hypothetical protein
MFNRAKQLYALRLYCLVGPSWGGALDAYRVFVTQSPNNQLLPALQKAEAKGEEGEGDNLVAMEVDEAAEVAALQDEGPPPKKGRGGGGSKKVGAGALPQLEM